MIDSYELILNHLTHGEFILNINKPDKFLDYAKTASRFLNHKGKHLFEEDILSQYSKDMTLEKLFLQNKDRFMPGMNQEKNGVRKPTWYDIEGMEEIKYDDDGYFAYFFICKLRHLSLLDIDSYLDFHLEYSFDNKKEEYLRFVSLAVRQHKKYLLSEEIVETVSEWIKLKEKQTIEPNAIDKEEKIKGRLQREAGDHLTSLTQNQTVLFIQYMQKAGILLKGEYLTFTQMGKAFNILTGYSAHTLRQQLGTKGDVAGVKHEDYKELHEVVLKIAKAIEEKIKK